MIIGCRNMELCESVRASIIEETCNHNVHCQNLDLASLESVRKFANEINSSKYCVCSCRLQYLFEMRICCKLYKSTAVCTHFGGSRTSKTADIHVNVVLCDFYSAKAELCDHCCLSVIRLSAVSNVTHEHVYGCRPNM